MDLSFLLRSAASKYPDRIAVVASDATLTYQQLDRRVDAIASGFRGLGLAGSAVASIMQNSADTVTLYLALARAGLVNVPVNYRLTNDEIRFILEDSQARTLVADAAHAMRARELLDLVPGLERVIIAGAAEHSSGVETLESLAATWDGRPVVVSVDEVAGSSVIYSSGTSGFPKGVVKSHRANVWGAVNAFIGSPRTPEDVELFVLPAFGIGFVAQLLPTFLAGACVVLDTVFEPNRAWQLLEEHRVTRAFLAPTMIASMLDVQDHDRFDVTSLHTISVAYEFAPALRKRALARFGPIFRNMYGLTEAQLTQTAPGEFPADPTNVGRPMGIARVLVVDPEGNETATGAVGEIVFEGPSVMSSYLGNPAATEAALEGDRVRTGDLGYVDDAGSVHFAGRLKEIVKSGGFNIDPVEVESVLLNHPDVVDAALIGVPDERWGERAVAFIVASRGDVDVEIVARHCKENLAGFKVPKEIVVLDSLPINATGKVHRAALRKHHLQHG